MDPDSPGSTVRDTYVIQCRPNVRSIANGANRCNAIPVGYYMYVCLIPFSFGSNYDDIGPNIRV